MLSIYERNKIITLHDTGMTNIAIAKKMNINRNSVSLWVNRFYDKDELIEKNHTGRRKKTTYEQDKEITNIVKNNTITKTDNIINKMENKPEISRSTICRILKNNDIVYGKFKRKPLLTEEHKYTRYTWALDHRFYNWIYTIFSDESSFWKDRSTCKCWYEVGNQKIKLSKSHSIKYHVWGCIILGEFKFYIFSGNLNSSRYIEILFENLIPIYSNEYVFQQDNSSIHKSKIVTEFFKRENINVLKFPPNSPDLNPIENIWAIIKHKLSEIEDITNENFKDKILECCKQIDFHCIFNSISNMHVRIQDVINKKGDITDY